MTLDFTLITPQVHQMSQEVGRRRHTLDERAKRARAKLRHWSHRLDEATAHVREADADFRGASPLMTPAGEPMADAYPLPSCPERATLVAVDGSQIYLDERATALYYLTNIGVLIYHHGADIAPECELDPQLFYLDDHIYAEGRLVNNTIVNTRRTKFERDRLAEAAWKCRRDARPLVAIADGPLLFWVGSEIPESEREQQIMPGYYMAMEKVRDIDHLFEGHAALVGYVDKPNSSYVVRLLQLLPPMDDAEDAEPEIFDGLADWALFGVTSDPLLAPGERSALFVQQSPYNQRYADRDPDLEITFFYLNTAMPGETPYLARVEVPMWVARNRELVDAVHALVYSQCQLYGRYPYILARADELAVVQGHEKRELDNMIDLALRRSGLSPDEKGEKPSGKENVWRASRERHSLAKGIR